MDRKEYIRQRRIERIEKLDPTKEVYILYPIIDCEHEGDISRAEYEAMQYVKPMGGDVIDSYWDGRDCGEAYVTCSIPFNKDNLLELMESGDFNTPYQS